MPAPAGARGGASRGVEATGGGLDVTGVGAGVVDDRVPEAVGGTSAGVGSTESINALDVKDIFECAAVARMALKRSKLFCCLFCPGGGLLTLTLAPVSEASPESACSSSEARFLLTSSEIDVSTIGHTKPVLGI